MSKDKLKALPGQWTFLAGSIAASTAEVDYNF